MKNDHISFTEYENKRVFLQNTYLVHSLNLRIKEFFLHNTYLGNNSSKVNRRHGNYRKRVQKSMFLCRFEKKFQSFCFENF